VSRFFFDGWTGLFRVFLVGVSAYVALIVLLRLSGKRTLSKMNAFDLIVTVALGSTLSSILISKDVALAEGVLALAVLIGLQFAVAFAASRSKRVSNWVKSEPAVLFHRGEFLHASLRRERVSEGEVVAAIRAQGIASVEAVEAVILETDGSFTALQRVGGGGNSTALRGTDVGDGSESPRAVLPRTTASEQ
jgi:uncharacterized membrane protein YcaP (DUF421 family)